MFSILLRSLHVLQVDVKSIFDAIVPQVRDNVGVLQLFVQVNLDLRLLSAGGFTVLFNGNHGTSYLAKSAILRNAVNAIKPRYVAGRHAP